jgi:2-C-methyl-D-erythritol 4-phosphate cytidylyltransferase
MGNLLEDGTSTEWVDRDKYIQIASPQCFKYDVIKSVYRKAEEKGILEKTEPHTTSLMYELGMKIYISKGNQTNIKITTREDVELFERYVRGGRN